MSRLIPVDALGSQAADAAGHYQAGAPRLSIHTLVGVALVFFWIFRPHVLHPLFSLALLPAVAGVLYLASSRRLLERTFAQLGPVFFILLAFLILFSLAVDLATGALSIIGARTQFFTTQRLVISLLGAVFIVAVLCRWQMRRFRYLLLGAIGVQLAFGLAMLLVPDFKRFMYMTVSGYTGSEKMFEEYFFGSRIFGWSEELFFLAPVVMVFASLIFIPRLTVARVGFLVLVVLISLFNARLAIFGVLFGLLIGFKTRLLVPSLLLGAGLFTAAAIGGPAVELFLAEFQGGRSRTLDILLADHVHLLLRDGDWIFGGHHYLYAGPNPPAFSDIGLIIILNYGGAIYLVAWLALAWCLVLRAFHSNWDRMMAYSLFLAASIKGLAFSGNALIALFIALALLGGYRGRIEKTERRLLVPAERVIPGLENPRDAHAGS
jgi:hypothetical protein